MKTPSTLILRDVQQMATGASRRCCHEPSQRSSHFSELILEPEAFSNLSLKNRSDGPISRNHNSGVISVKRKDGQTWRVRNFETNNVRVIRNVNSQDLHSQDVQQRGQGTALSDPTRGAERLSGVSIKKNGALNVGIEQTDPSNKRRVKTHLGKGRIQEGPIHVIKDLLLIQRQDRERVIGLGSIRDDVSQKGDILTDVAAGHPASLIRAIT